ncbi:MAG TPA: hypothetical protein VFN67_16615 [Polyangiales bacterium]|jgi:hypothetical protein|nr:hypothetical protein [Polyangiales bacterium]
MTSDSDPIPEPELDANQAAWSERERDLAAAYARGDFVHVRTRARALAGDENAPAEVREHARSWSARVSVDVVVYAMLAFALALFCAIVLRYALP